MPNRNEKYRYSRNLQGWNAHGFFTNATAITALDPFSSFVAGAAQGELGIFLKDGTLKLDALATGDDFFIAQKIDESVKKSVIMTFGPSSLDTRKTVFDAPVFQTDVAGYNGTSGSLNITFTGALQEFVVRVSDLTPGNQPFPVTEGRAVVRLAGATVYDDVVKHIVDDMNAVFDFEQNSDDLPFITADVLNSATDVVTATVVDYTLVKGSTVVGMSADGSGEFTVGDYITFTPTGVLGGRSWFKVVSLSATAVVIDRPWPFASEVLAQSEVFELVVADGDAGEFGIRVRTIVEPTLIETGVGEDLAGATLSNLVPWKQGSGAGFQVHFMEEETQVFAGWTTINEAWTQDYGQPTKFVPFDTDNNYDLWFFDYRKTTPSAAPPLEETIGIGNNIIGALEGGSVAGSLDTIFST